MGKKSKFKAIRRLASQLPQIETGHRVGTQVRGAELLKSGTEKLSNGEAIDPKKTYRKVTTEPVALNHNRKMKKIFMKHGGQAVLQYARAVVNHVEIEKMKAESEVEK